uniref:WW domain-binding protein 4 n=1 Tax=Panagrolaimus davidi TaxID=227884 RepID=A0A914QA52_9BILA
MSEYWKSNAKKYCEICKCWFADNKISVENHEKGLRHKGAVQARLREVSKKANETERANEKLASTLMQMEQAAIMSMNGAVRSSGGSSSSFGPSPRGTVLPKIERKSEYEEAKAKVKAEKERMKELKKTAKKSTLWQEDEQCSIPNPYLTSTTKIQAAEVPAGESEGIQWVQTASDDGKTYFFNIYTGETRWDIPSNYYTIEQYQQYYAQIVASTSLEGTAYDAYIDPSMSQQYYSYEPEPPQVPIQTIETVSTSVPEKLPSSPPKPKRMKLEGEEEQQIETQDEFSSDYKNIQPELEQLSEQFNQEPIQQDYSRAKTSAGGLLGGWVPVEKKPEIVVEKQEKL